jgi:hypothetical protein
MESKGMDVYTTDSTFACGSDVQTVCAHLIQMNWKWLEKRKI